MNFTRILFIISSFIIYVTYRLIIDQRQEDLAYIQFPCDLDAPKPTILPKFPGSKHGLRSRNITVLDTKTFFIPDLYYDGKGPEAFFWVGTGSQPHAGGTKVTKGITLDRTRRPLW